jgi:hypothetical protein
MPKTGYQVGRACLDEVMMLAAQVASEPKNSGSGIINAQSLEKPM